MATSHHTQESFSSNQKVESIHSDKILELGERLVEEFGLDQTVDTLGRWMAHYVAELIQAVEDADADERAERMEQCNAVIKDLWKHRHYYPDGKRPFEDFESVMRALKSLDPNSDHFRYFDSIRQMIERDEISGESKVWFDIVEEVEDTAKIIIQYCITRAAEQAVDKSKEWVKHVDAINSEDDIKIDIKIIKALDDPSGQSLSLSDEQSERKQLEDRLNKLERFKSYAEMVASKLQQKIGELDDSD